MTDNRYLHRLEYRREVSKYKRELVYTELADDHGFCFRKRTRTREESLDIYTRLCAEDYLDRVHAPAGTWLITVYRLWPEPVNLCTIRLTWSG